MEGNVSLINLQVLIYILPEFAGLVDISVDSYSANSFPFQASFSFMSEFTLLLSRMIKLSVMTASAVLKSIDSEGTEDPSFPSYAMFFRRFVDKFVKLFKINIQWN